MAPLGQRYSRAGKALTMSLALLMSIGTTATLAGSKRPRPEAACVAYDLHILTLIEDHGLVEDTEPQVLQQAAFTMLEARVACREGDVNRALQLYDSIGLDYVPMTPFYRILMR